jgi:hypothetical protein
MTGWPYDASFCVHLARKEPWLRLPEAERQLGHDILGDYLSDELPGIAASWQHGTTLYTHLSLDDWSHLLAIRSSGHVDVLAQWLPTSRILDAWQLLTAPQAPTEPLAQLALEDLVVADLTTRSALAELDLIEQARYEDGRSFVAFAQATGALTAADAHELTAGAKPDTVHLDAYEREMTAHEQGLLERWSGELQLDGLAAHLYVGGRFEAVSAEAADPYAALVESWWHPPSSENDPAPGTHVCSPLCALPQSRIRPHAYRTDAQLHAQLGLAHRAAEQALARHWSVQRVDERMLRWDAAHEYGPAASRLRRRSLRLAEAARLMRHAAATKRELARPDVNLAFLARVDKRARRRLGCWTSGAKELREAYRILAAGLREDIARRARAERDRQQADDDLARARALVPDSADPEGDSALLEAGRRRLLEDAVAEDLLGVPDRAARLEEEAAGWESLRTWCWRWQFTIEEELRIRHHTRCRPTPTPRHLRALDPDAVLDAYRRAEHRPDTHLDLP